MSNKFSGNENVAYLWYNKITCNGYENNLSSIISLVFVNYRLNQGDSEAEAKAYAAKRTAELWNSGKVIFTGRSE